MMKKAQLTTSQRRQMWNEFADDVTFAAVLLIGGRELPDFDGREVLHKRLLLISSMIRRSGRGRPSAGRTGKAQMAAVAVAARVRQRRKTWLSENGKRKLPESLQDTFIKEESEAEWNQTGVRPVAGAVKGVLRRGHPKKRNGFSLQEFKRDLEQEWLRGRSAK